MTPSLESKADKRIGPRPSDNWFALKGAATGIQTAGWTPGPAAMRGLGCRVIADAMIPVEEGIALGSDIYLPKTPGRYPAVLAFAAYSKELPSSGAPAGTNEVGSPPLFTDRGYAHVIVERRGMGISGGDTAVFFNDRDVDDHEKVIAWIAAQPWCDGNVVLFGTSYYGCTQPMVAVRRPPALKAFFAIEVCTDFYRHIAAFGGTANLYFLNLWMGANFSSAVMSLRMPPVVRALASHVLNSRLRKVWWPFFQKRLPRIMRRLMHGTPVREVREMWINFIVDGKTRASCTIPTGPHANLDAIEVPFVTVQNLGMFNLHQFGSYELFQKAGTPKGAKRLIVGKPSYELPSYEWQEEALAFFDHVLRGQHNGYANQPAVRYWVDGADCFDGADDFPVPCAQVVRLHPASAGADAAVHHLAAHPGGGHNTWVAVPLGALLPGGLDEIMTQKLVFDLPIDRTTTLAGPVTANLLFSSNEIDSYVLARLARVDRAGADHLLSLGAICPARRHIDPTRGSAIEIAMDTDVREPLVPGKPVVLRFSLTPGPVRLQPGERLRLTIASRTDLVRSDTAHDHAHFDFQVPPYFARNTLHYGADTYIELQQV